MQTESATIPVTLKVNGTEHRLSVEPDRTLLQVLREDLRLTGTKLGCDDGTCGTCVVTVNGAMARACRVPIERVQHKEVLTIEGLGTRDHLHPLQQAFIDCDALQCGYCTTGMILSAVALLESQPDAGREDILRAMNGNICRCGTYTRIIAAIEQAAKAMKGGAK